MNENTTRRNFLKTSGAVGLGLGLLSRGGPLLRRLRLKHREVLRHKAEGGESSRHNSPG